MISFDAELLFQLSHILYFPILLFDYVFIQYFPSILTITLPPTFPIEPLELRFQILYPLLLRVEALPVLFFFSMEKVVLTSDLDLQLESVLALTSLDRMHLGLGLAKGP